MDSWQNKSLEYAETPCGSFEPGADESNRVEEYDLVTLQYVGSDRHVQEQRWRLAMKMHYTLLGAAILDSLLIVFRSWLFVIHNSRTCRVESKFRMRPPSDFKVGSVKPAYLHSYTQTVRNSHHGHKSSLRCL